MTVKTLKLDAASEIDVDGAKYVQSVCERPIGHGRYWQVVPPTLAEKHRDIEFEPGAIAYAGMWECGRTTAHNNYIYQENIAK